MVRPISRFIYSRARMTQLQLTTRPSPGTACPIDAAPSPPRVGPWQLVRLAAEGPLAQIWQARPADARRELPAAYAVKTLLPQWVNEPSAVATIHREAVLGRLVTHPHLIPVLAADVAGPPYYLVMPWLNGQSLAQRMADVRRIDLPVALWIVRQVAEALEALDTAGWMHGDVKPSNIFLSPENHVTLLDLGFARRPQQPGSLAERCVLGTCHYLAPETITSALRPDIRSDLYSLGVVLFEMLAGRVPFEGDQLSEILAQHRQNRPPSLRKWAPNVPAGVACLVAGMLAKQPLRRPQTPRELIEQLAGLEILTFAQRVV